MSDDAQATALLIPVDVQEAAPEDREFKYCYRLNLNPGTSRHLLESTAPIRFKGPQKSSIWGRANLAEVEVSGKTRITHESGDHDPIYLPPGNYGLRLLLEYDPWNETHIAVYD